MQRWEKIIKLPQISLVISNDEKYIGPVYTEYRISAPLKSFPKHLLSAVLSAEDKRFFSHNGFDLIALSRAIWKNFKNFKIIQGGSTITQQLIRIGLLHSNERTLKRKLLELIMAIKIEQILSKEEILEAYLNAIYLGSNVYGMKMAAWEYFRKDVSEINLNEAAYLAGLIRAPNKYRNEKTILRKNEVLKLMYKNGYINRDEFVSYSSTVVKPFSFRNFKFNYTLDYIKNYLLKNHSNLFPFERMLIKTTFDIKRQSGIDQIIEKILSHNNSFLICSLVLDKDNSGIKVIINKPSIEAQYFNIAANGYLQLGSTIKPFILAEALKQGFSLENKFESKKLCIDLSNGEKWEVKNYNNIYRGDISLSDALIYSDNTVFAQLILRMDINKLGEFLKEINLDIGEPRPALAAGASCKGISPLQISAAYTIFANKGYYSSPTPISELRTFEGKMLFKANFSPRFVLDSSIANEIDDLLKRAASEGTGILKEYQNPNLRAKTGTTDTDSWYVSYDDEYIVLTWVKENSKNESIKNSKTIFEVKNLINLKDLFKKESPQKRNPEKAITAKLLAEKIWKYLKEKNNLSDFFEIAKGIEQLDSTQATELEAFFMPWGKYGKICT